MKYHVILFCILSISIQAQKPWNYYVIDNVGSGADGVKIGDLNSDQRLDIITGWEESGITKVYLQPGPSKIKDKWESGLVGKTPNVEDAVFADMNKNGELDVVSCTENNSQKIFIHWNPQKDYLEPNNWKQEVLPASDGLMSWMYAEPMQVDGRNGIDLIAAGKGNNAAIGWFEAPTSANNLKAWKWHEISKVGWIMSILKEDMDADGDLDLVISDRKGKLCGCRWLENPGVEGNQASTWANHFIGAQGLEVMFMTIKDLDNDGQKECVVAERTNNTIRIYNREEKNWHESVIELPLFTGKAKSVEVGDINNDGYQDLIVSTNTLEQQKNGLVWLNGLFIDKPKEENWLSISGVHKAKYDKVELLDLDKDGDLDVLICEENYGKNSEGLGVVWYENPTVE